MPHDRRTIVASRRAIVPALAQLFGPLEENASATAGMASAFVAALVDAHRSAALAPTAGAAALAAAEEASRLSLAARARIMELHEMLRDLPQELGLEASSPECPGDLMTAPPAFRVVA